MKARRLPEATIGDPARLIGDRYELGRLLGCGGMSNVYRARDRVTGHAVAVKLFRPGIDYADAQRRRRRELDVLSSLQHEGLVAVLDADTSDSDTYSDTDAETANDSAADGATYLVIELVDGPTLSRQLRDGPLPEREVLALGATLCSAVAYMHARGIVHRDIKPANILLADVADAPDLGPKLTDFGIARVVDGTAMTGEGLTVGTANYLSPEQVTAQAVGPSSDVYSLGLVLLEALSATIVYPGHGVEAALTRLHREPVLPTWIGADVADLLTRMTARQPELRPSAQDAAAELAALVDTAPGAALGTDIFAIDNRGREAARATHRRDRSRARLRFGLLAGAAATVVAVMTSGLVFVTQDSSAPDTTPVAALAPPPLRTTPSASSAAAAPSTTPAPSTGAPSPAAAPSSRAARIQDAVAADLAAMRLPQSRPSTRASTPARTVRTSTTSHRPTTAGAARAAKIAQAKARARHAAAVRHRQARARHVVAPRPKPPAPPRPHRRPA